MLSEEDGRAIGTLIDSPTAHTLTHMASQNGGNSSTLRQFAGSGLNVPVEIVETSTIDSTSEGADPRDHDSMEISIEEISQGEESQSLADSLVNDIKTHAQLEDMVLNPSISHSAVDSTQLTPSQHSSALTIPGVETNTTQPPTDSTPSALSANSYLSNPLDPHLTMQQVSQSALQHFQEVSRTLRDEGIEISPENLATHFPHSLAESLAASLIGHSSQSSAAATILESVINQSAQLGIDYGDISDVSRVINDPNLTATSCNNEQIGNRGEMDPVLSDTHHVPVPSSPDSNFDTNELLNSSLTQDMEVTTKLANAGPVGVAAAAAIMSGRKRKRHVFESNPALRKRHCSKLMRRLKETLDELSTRVGVQVCLVTYRPSSKQEKPEPAFRIYGTSPLYGAIEEQKDRIIYMMDEQLKKQIPSSSPTMPILNKQLYELPPLVFDGIPTPVHEMTQSQLRAFIPNMLKYSTSRGKPGWGKEEMKPAWWPSDVPWQNVRSDVRSEAEKKVISWTECLRKLVVSCYTHHGRMDLLQAFEKKSQEDALVNEAQNLLSHGIDLSDVVANGGVGPLDVTGSQEMNDSQQVFTIDTGMGNCDTSSMPTLADASLAETAARLQQVADETGQVQYATQTVTVTEGDSKALGQPVGSTTTVLLTAYPSGQTQPVAGDSQQYYQAPETSNAVSPNPSTASAPSVQVVYNASHVSELPESLVSSDYINNYESETVEKPSDLLNKDISTEQ